MNKFVTAKDSTPEKMHGKVKKHKIDNSTRVVTSGCNTALEYLSIFCKKCALLYCNWTTIKKYRYKAHGGIINNLNSLDLPLNSILVCFDIIKMFQNINNNLGLSSVKNKFRFM